MPLEACEEAYLNISKMAFQPKRSRLHPFRLKDKYKAKEKFDSELLKRSILSVIDGEIKRSKLLQGGLLEEDNAADLKLLKKGDTECKV